MRTLDTRTCKAELKYALCIVVDYNCTHSISPIEVRFSGNLKTLQRRKCSYNPMLGWIIEQNCECHGQCLSTSCSRGHQLECIKTVSFVKNDLHLPWHTSTVIDTPADHRSNDSKLFGPHRSSCREIPLVSGRLLSQFKWVQKVHFGRTGNCSSVIVDA